MGMLKKRKTPFIVIYYWLWRGWICRLHINAHAAWVCVCSSSRLTKDSHWGMQSSRQSHVILDYTVSESVTEWKGRRLWQRPNNQLIAGLDASSSLLSYQLGKSNKWGGKHSVKLHKAMMIRLWSLANDSQRRCALSRHFMVAVILTICQHFHILPHTNLILGAPLFMSR